MSYYLKSYFTIRGETDSDRAFDDFLESTGYNTPHVSRASRDEEGVPRFLSKEEIVLIGKRLRNSDYLQARLGALNALQTDAALCNASEYWSLLKNGLRSALYDPKTFQLSLNIHLRLLSYDPLSAKESYVNLAEAVLDSYTQRPSFLRENGLIVIKSLMLFNESLPENWLRYPESYVADVATTLFQVLSLNHLDENCATPLKVACFVSPGFQWIRNWFHGNFGRNMILKHIPAELFCYFYRESTRLLKAFSIRDWISISKKDFAVWDEALSTYASFLSSLTFIVQCLRFKRGRERLIFEVGNSSIDYFVTKLMEFITEDCSCGPFEFVTNSMVEVIRANQIWMIEKYVIEKGFLSKLVANVESTKSKFICQILSVIYSSHCFLKDCEEDKTILKLCSAVVSSQNKSIELPVAGELIKDILSSYRRSLNKEAQSTIHALCDRALDDKSSIRLASYLYEICIKNPINFRSVLNCKKTFVKLLLKNHHLKSHPRAWNMEDNDYSSKLASVALNNPEKPILIEKLLTLWASTTNVRKIVSEYFSLPTYDLSLIIRACFSSLDLYVCLKSIKTFKNEYEKRLADSGEMIDEDTLILRYFVRFFQSLGTLEDKQLHAFSLNPPLAQITCQRKIVYRDEEVNDEAENDFLRYLEIYEDEWLEESRSRYENISPSTVLSRRALIKLFDRICTDKEIVDLGTRETPTSAEGLSVVFSLFENSSFFASQSGDEWKSDLEKLNALDENDQVFSWISASVYFATDYPTAVRVLKAKIFDISTDHFAHFSEMILMEKVPAVYQLLMEKSLLPSVLFLKWFKSSFFNVLPWEEIRRFLSLIALFGLEYSIYICVSICHHVQKIILSRAEYDEDIFFVERVFTLSIEDFRVGDYLQYMLSLKNEYSSIMLPYF